MDRTYVRRLGLPRPVAVSTDPAGLPVAVGGRAVEHLATSGGSRRAGGRGGRVRRAYFDLVLADGRNTVVFCDRRRGRWYAQRA